MKINKNIVLLHGWGASTEKLRPLARELKGLGWSVFLLKLPGFEMEPPSRAWGVDDYADYVVRIANVKFGSKKFFVFGHSFGGRIAIKAAIRNKAQLKGVILCSAGGISRGYELVRLMFYLLAKVGKVFLIIPPLAFFWRKVIYKLAREHDYEKVKGIMKEVFKKVISEDLKPHLALIEIPTLILWGKGDGVTPVKDAYFIEKEVKKTKLEIFSDQGHRLPYERPKDVARKIDKWEKILG